MTDTTAQRSILQTAAVGNRYPTIGRFLMQPAVSTSPNVSSVIVAPPVLSVTPPVLSVTPPVLPKIAEDQQALSLAYDVAVPTEPEFVAAVEDPFSQDQQLLHDQQPPQDQKSSADLDLLDSLVTQAVLNRSQQFEPTAQAQQSSRQKEMLNAVDSLPTQEVAMEVAPEVLQPALEASENLSTPENVEIQELSAELQEVSKETKEQREQAEIKEKQAAISELAKTVTTPVSVSNQPVVVLPITAKSKEEARFKSPKYSVVWLWEWCKKITKIFEGAVVYKEEVDKNS